MPNHNRTHADGVYVTGFQMPASSWEDLERKIFGSWNGDRGGAYTLIGVLSILGSGLHVSGPVRLSGGGTLYVTDPDGAVIPDGSWPEVGLAHAGRHRSILQPIHNYVSPREYHWSRNHPYAGVGSVALAVRSTFGRVIEVPELYIPLHVIDGSTMLSVEVRFRVALPRLVGPVAMPKVRILRVPKDSVSDAPQPLKSTEDLTGFWSPALVTSPEAWYLGGVAQSFTYVCDQNNVIDTANYSYVVHLVEEQGVLSPDDPFDGIKLVEKKPDVLCVGPNSLTLNGTAVVVDNYGPLPTDSRVLIIDDDATLDGGTTISASAKNGIWKVTGAAEDWARVGDLDEEQDFTPNAIVRVFYGAVNGGALWQLESPSNASKIQLTGGLPDGAGGFTPAVASENYTQPRFVPAKPKGNIYHALIPTFEVPDLRFQ